MSWIAYTVLYLERCGVHYWGGSVGSLLWVIYILGTWLPSYLCPIVLAVGEQARAVGSLCCSLWSHLNWSKLVVRFKILLHTAHCPLPTAHCMCLQCPPPSALFLTFSCFRNSNHSTGTSPISFPYENPKQMIEFLFSLILCNLQIL